MIITKDSISINKIKTAASKYGKAYNIDRIYLFDSYARGEANADSNVGLRVNTGRLKGFFSLLASISICKKHLVKKSIFCLSIN